MATLTIRELDEDVRTQLRVRAARHGRSMEAEVRAILSAAVAKTTEATGLASRVHQRFAAIGGAELDQPTRTDQPRIPELPA